MRAPFRRGLLTMTLLYAISLAQAFMPGYQSQTVLFQPSRKLRRRTLGLVVEWAAGHREELLETWRLAEAHQPLNRIEPLE
jgi:hypothetical protein